MIVTHFSTSIWFKSWVATFSDQNCTLQKEVGSFKCNNPQCLVCVKLNVTVTNTFASTVTSKAYKINHTFYCDENCLVCLLTCKHCGIQYVGQSVGDFCYQYNKCKDNYRKHTHNGTLYAKTSAWSPCVL